MVRLSALLHHVSPRLSLRLLAPILLATFACKGPEGAVGPQGPEGPQGPPGRSALYTTTIGPDGSAAVTLSSLAGTDLNRPPGVICYTKAASGVSWIVIASAPDWLACGIVLSGGVFRAVMVNGVPGYLAAFSITY